jgi:hypothetical protein
MLFRGSLPTGKVMHGASDAYERHQRYRFTQEVTRVQQSGVVRRLRENTGMGFCYGGGTELRIADLLPHLVDAYDLYADNTGNLPRLVPIHHATVLFSQGSAWIKLDVLKEDLRQRADVGPESLLNAATVFATTFKLVQDGNERTASYEMTNPIVARQQDGTGRSPRPRDRLGAVFGRMRVMMNSSSANINDPSCWWGRSWSGWVFGALLLLSGVE